MAKQWGLDPTVLGILEDGSGMDFDVAAALPRRIGKDALFAYVQQVFATTDQAAVGLHSEQFQTTRSSIMEYAYDTASRKIWRAQGPETTLAADL